LPERFDRYYEPFVGGGAVFFAVAPDRAVLSDASSDLITCYAQIRDTPEELINRLGKLENSEHEYYRVRATNPLDPIDSAVRLLYLMRLSFNGIYRVNLHGQFNVPYGRKTHLLPCEPEKIRAASAALQGAELRHADFQSALKDANSGDLVYLDPPYTVAHNNNAFVKYNDRIFSWSDQLRLADVAHELVERGCKVVVTNADHESVRDLYSDFRAVGIKRASVMAADRRYRRPVTECLFIGGD
jgi:DNA adenine methylase